MDIENIKFLESTNVCRFPPEQNLNILSLTYLSGRLGFIKRNKLWISLTLIGVYFGYTFIQYRLSLGDWEPVSSPLNNDFGSIVQLAAVGFIVVILAALTFGRSAPSGRTRITRSSAESVDGFGGARAADFSYGPTGMSSTPGFPVSLRQERKRTATFREGAKEHDDEGMEQT